jgi:hypothetical protein
MRSGLFLFLALILALTPSVGAAVPASTDTDAYADVPSVPYTYTSPDKTNPYNVAIFRDELPWADDQVDQVLIANGISFTVFTSADIGLVSLGAYDKVILASDQTPDFVSAVAANAGWFEDYAANGGYLLCSMAHQSFDISPGTIYPGPTTLTSWSTHDTMNIVEPAHPVFNVPNAVNDADLSNWSASTHGELEMPGGTVLLVNGDTGNPALAEMPFGYGYIMATTQTFEFSLADPGAVENLVLHRFVNPDTPLRTAVFRDVLPWGNSGTDLALQNNGIPYTVFTSADIGVVDLSEFDKVMIESVQPPTFIAAVEANTAWFEAWAETGGILISSMCGYSLDMLPGTVYPGGAVFTEWVGSPTVNLVAPAHPLFNAPNPIVADDLAFGWSSHGHIDVPEGAVLATSNAPGNGPILMSRAWGLGTIITTTLTYPLLSAEFTENLVLFAPQAYPEITAITDVGNDQGRQVRLVWNRSGFDVQASGNVVTGYEIYREQGAEKEAGWDYIATVPAHGDAVYQAIAPTLCDSTIADGLCETTFKVKAVTGDPYTFYDSAPASGYSVDNLAPAVPVGLMVVGDVLSWVESPDADFDYFTVYGSATPDMNDVTFLAHTTGTSLDVTDAGFVYLLVTATDFAGNESGAGVSDPVSAAGDTPTSFRLLGAAPNPFNPATAIRFELPGTRTVDLRIYDASGRLVRELLHGETRGVGRHNVPWDGRDAGGRAVAAGVYFYTLETGIESDAGRMVLVK